jgi:TP901 family phage tail tape measure protein
VSTIAHLLVKVDVDSKKLMSLGGIAKTAGKAIGAGLALATGAGVAAVKMFADFDSAMNESVAIMGDVSDAMRKDMSDAAREVAKTTTFSAEEAAKSYFFLASAGMDAEQSIAAMPAVANFAQAGMFDMATATDLATDAQSALGLSSDDAAENLEGLIRVTDVFVKANTLANTSVEQISEAMTNKAGAAMRAVGMEIEEGAAVLAAFADQGVKGANAGTQFAIVLRDLQTKALANKGAFKAAGVEVFDASGEFRNMADIVGDLETHLDGMSDAQKRAALSALGFSDKSMGALSSLLGTSDAIREYQSELEAASGITDEIAGKQLNTLNAQFSLLKSRIADAAIEIGGKLEPHVRKIVEAMSAWMDENGHVVDSIANWVGKTIDQVGRIGPAIAGAFEFVRNLISQVGNLWSAFSEEGAGGAAEVIDNMFGNSGDLIGPIKAGIETVTDVFGDVVTILRVAVIPAVSQVFQVFTSSLPLIIGPLGLVRAVLGFIADNAELLQPLVAGLVAGFLAFKTVTFVLGLVKGAMAALNVVMALNPIGLVVAAIAALVAGLIYAYNNFEGFRDFVDGAWDAIVGVFKGAADVITGVWDAVVGFFKGVWDALTGNAESGTSTIQAVINTFLGALTGDWSRAWDGMKTLFSRAWDAIKTLASRAWDAFKQLFSDALMRLAAAARDGLASVADWFKDLPGRILDALGNLGSLLINAGKSIIEGLWTGIKSMGGWLAEKVGGFIKDKIPGPIANILGIESPSKVAAELGARVTEGLALGMSKDLRLVERSAMRLAAASLPSVSGVRVPGSHGVSGVSSVGGSSESYSPTIHFDLPSGETRTNVQYASLVLANRHLVRGGLRGGAR